MENTPATNPGARLVWNLKTHKACDISHWSRDVQLYDVPCGFTPDNRIWTLFTNPQPLAEGNTAYTPRIYLQNPDGTGKLICEDNSRHLVFDQKSFFDEAVDARFSSDGRVLWLLSNSYFRQFDARSGKLSLRRRMGSRHRQERAANLSLSPDGSKIIASDDVDDLRTGQESWRVYVSRNGRFVRSLIHPKGARSPSWFQNDIYLCWTDDAWIYCRFPDGKVLWQEKFPAPPLPNAPTTRLILRNPRNGQRRVLVPSLGKWKFLTASPDRKTLYGVNFSGGIYKMTSVDK